METKRKTKTSAAVKNRYAAKHYKRWSVAIKFDLFDRLEKAAAAEGSRRLLLEKLMELYEREAENGSYQKCDNE